MIFRQNKAAVIRRAGMQLISLRVVFSSISFHSFQNTRLLTRSTRQSEKSYCGFLIHTTAFFLFHYVRPQLLKVPCYISFVRMCRSPLQDWKRDSLTIQQFCRNRTNSPLSSSCNQQHHPCQKQRTNILLSIEVFPYKIPPMHRMSLNGDSAVSNATLVRTGPRQPLSERAASGVGLKLLF